MSLRARRQSTSFSPQRRAKIANPRVLQAKALARSGFAVLPLYEPTAHGCGCRNRDCARVGKHPRTRNGVKDATTDVNVIDDWWTRLPNANIGIATGKVSTSQWSISIRKTP